jgi:5-formyltetrahydrofolate cyclo-ligase
MIVGFYWPFQGEFDARPFVTDLRRRGVRAVLTAVVAKSQPLEFREWWPGVAMANGVYDLPVPDGTFVFTPDALLIPALGVGSNGYRLGYGGGYFDRTLAAMTIPGLPKVPSSDHIDIDEKGWIVGLF